MRTAEHNPAVHRTLREKAAQRPVTSTLGALMTRAYLAFRRQYG